MESWPPAWTLVTNELPLGTNAYHIARSKNGTLDVRLEALPTIVSVFGNFKRDTWLEDLTAHTGKVAKLVIPHTHRIHRLDLSGYSFPPNPEAHGLLRCTMPLLTSLSLTDASRLSALPPMMQRLFEAHVQQLHRLRIGYLPQAFQMSESYNALNLRSLTLYNQPTCMRDVVAFVRKCQNLEFADIACIDS